VTSSTDIAAPPSANGLPARIGWAVLICATLYVCYFSHLGAIGFVGPDEPRYAWIARDMVETGDWVTPRLYGKPWFEKPPLFYWGAAICFKACGVSEAAARLPSAISALLATLALAWLAWRIYGADTARWLLLLLPTTVGMIGFSHAAATDMPFSAMLTIAMVCAAVVLELAPHESCGPGARHAAPLRSDPHATRRRWFARILFGFFLGLAVLAKGPAGVILCGGAIFFWALFTKRWRDALRLLHPAAIAAFCVTALPWYILCARRNPDFFRIFIIEHNFKRYLTPEFQHIQPFWFYIPVLLAALLPWTAGLFLVLANAASRAMPSFYFLSFALFSVAFFTISRSKLPGYILPAVPAFACLIATAVATRRGKRILAAISATTAAGLATAIFFYAAHRALGTDIVPAPWTANVELSLFVAALVAAILAIRMASAALCVLQMGIVLAVWFFSSGLVWVDPLFSARGVINTSRESLRSLAAADIAVYDLPRGIHYGLNFYLRREMPEWSPGNSDAVFTSYKGQSVLTKAGYQCQSHLVFPAAILCRAKNLTAGAARGGKVQ